MQIPFEFDLKTKIICGEGKHKELGTCIKSIAHTNKAIIVTDKGVLSTGMVDYVEEALTGHNIKYNIFSNLDSEPTVKSIDSAAAAIKKIKANCVIGIGGGSAMDVAKMASLVAAADESATHYELMNNPFPVSEIKTIMIPTTSGTGAEITSTVVFSNEEKRKVWAWDEQLAPDIALLDPLFTVRLPPHLTAATTLDALIHAMEACTGKRSNPVIEAFGLKAIELICDHFLHVIQNPEDIKGRTALSLGATFAGVAIENGGTGIAHCIGHAIGTIGKVHHGKAVTIAMQAAYFWNLESNLPMYVKIAKAMGIDTNGMNESEIAYAGAERFMELVKLSRLDTSLDDNIFNESNLDDFVATMLAEENAPMRDNNCGFAVEADLRLLAEQVITKNKVF